MIQPLASKLRPRNLAQVVGQDHIVRAINYSIHTNTTHHAYCFTGPRGTGKTTTARLFAAKLNCLVSDQPNPCGSCSSCTDIKYQQHVNYIELDAAQHRGVEDVEALLRTSVYKPITASYKIYVIDEAHMLTPHAFNSLLKSLEEPPKHVKFILCSTEEHKIPLTALSRTIHFSFQLINPAKLLQFAITTCKKENIEYELQAVHTMVHAANGSVRDLLNIIDRNLALAQGRTLSLALFNHALGVVPRCYLYLLFKALYNQDVKQVTTVLQNISNSCQSPLQAVNQMLETLTTIMLQNNHEVCTYTRFCYKMYKQLLFVHKTMMFGSIKWSDLTTMLLHAAISN